MNTTVYPALRPATRVRRERGFSLIELMVVVAIISILATIALPQYQKYAAKAKVAGALSELSAGKLGVEALIAEGFVEGALSAEDVGLPAQGQHCQRFEAYGYAGEFNLSCAVKPDRYLGVSVHLNLERSVYSNAWTCRAYILDESLLPEMCRRS